MKTRNVYLTICFHVSSNIIDFILIERMRSAVWSPDGNYIAAGSEDCSVKIFDFVNRKTAPNFLSFFGVNQSKFLYL